MRDAPISGIQEHITETKVSASYMEANNSNRDSSKNKRVWGCQWVGLYLPVDAMVVEEYGARELQCGC